MPPHPHSPLQRVLVSYRCQDEASKRLATWPMGTPGRRQETRSIPLHLGTSF